MNIKRVLIILAVTGTFNISFAEGGGVPTIDFGAVAQMREQVKKAKEQLDAMTGNLKYFQKIYADFEDLQSEIKSLNKYADYFKNPKNLLRMSPVDRMNYTAQMNAEAYQSIAKSQERITRLSREADLSKGTKEAIDINNAINLEKTKLDASKILLEISNNLSQESTKMNRLNQANVNSCELARQVNSQRMMNVYCNIVVDSSELKKLQADSSYDDSNLSSPTTKTLGSISSKYETGGRGAGTINSINSDKNDYGGRSYGSYQITQRNVPNYLKNSRYKDEFKGLKVNTPAFDKKWREIAKRDPNGFAQDQRNYIQKTHYEPQVKRLKQGGIDFSNRSQAVQEMTWSTSVQYGGNTDVIKNALKGKNVDSMSDEQIINEVQNYKAKTVNSYFGKSSPGIRDSVKNRHNKELKDLLDFLKKEKGN
ncbi:hypothetical protein GKC56_05455 [Neisseriaceae bacterium PsAf]|nr:hypothetical protein [Neisseriaceae bacterium PsAf]